MTTQYQVPLHFCQWCYKNTGRFIVDCLCLVCEPCFKAKKDWIDEKGSCFNCNKNTSRKCIDLKTNPQEGGFYFQNINNSFRNVIRIQQFQQQVTKKYCKHLEVKVKKLDTIIRTFITQFPQFGAFFENAFRQMQQRQNNSFRSKSAETQIPQNQAGKRMMHQNNTERTMNVKPQQIQQANYQNHKYAQNNIQRNTNYPPQYEKKEKNYSVASKVSSQASMESFDTNVYQNQVKRPVYQKQPNIESVAKHNIRKESSKIVINPAKGLIQSNQAYQPNQPNQIYVIGGSKKFSDPTKQPQQMKLNNAVNIQTAIRSIRSEDQRVFPPFQSNNKSRQSNNLQNSQASQFMHPNKSNIKDNGKQNHPVFQKFGRKSK